MSAATTLRVRGLGARCALIALEPIRRPSRRHVAYLVRLHGTDDELISISVRSAIEEHLRACAIGQGAYRFGGWIQAYGTSRSDSPDCPHDIVDHEG